MNRDSEVFVAFDTAKKKHAVAVADGDRHGEVRYLGEIDSSPAAIHQIKVTSPNDLALYCSGADPPCTSVSMRPCRRRGCFRDRTVSEIRQFVDEDQASTLLDNLVGAAEQRRRLVDRKASASRERTT